MTDMTPPPGATQSADSPTDRTAWAVAGAALLGALAMTSCCILPLVLVSLGVTGVFIAQLGALYAYKWITFALSAVFLAYGFWKAYRPAPAAGCADGSCARPIGRGLMRALLWLSAALVALALVFPVLAPLILSY